jgi:RHS repeat-associated protein
MRFFATAVVCLFWLFCADVSAQTAKSITEEYDNAIKAAQTVTAFGPDLFGEAVNLKDGTTSFSATDVSLRTNSGLPVSIGRSYGVNSRDTDAYVNLAVDGELFGNWKLEVPTISGIYDERTGWVSRMPNPQQRCAVSSWSYAGAPAVPSVYSYWNITYNSEQYWSGDRITIPGKGQFPLLYLPSDRARPSDGRTYYWTTKSDWRVACVPTLKNGSGDGFMVVLPDGSRYTFDWLSSRKVAALMDTQCGQGGHTGGISCKEAIVVNRREYTLHATRVEDRFGNWVAYDYDPANPRRLRTITSNDGVSVALAYGNNGKITSITSGVQTWQYQYTDASNGSLAAVVQPDGSRWTFQYGDMYWLLQQQRVVWADCDPVLPPTDRTEAITIGHPAGATGVFRFKKLLHGTDRTPGVCVPNESQPTKPALSLIPAVYKAASLISKQVSGPGLTPQTWTYVYQPSWSWSPSGYADDCTPPIQCNATSETRVTGPDGVVTRSVFGNDYWRTAGQLQRVDIIDGATVVQSTVYAYLPDAVGQNFPDRAGWDPNARSNRLETELNRPQRSVSVTREGVAYTSEVSVCLGQAYCFDTYLRPTQIVKSNTLGHSRTDATTYRDDLATWVMGQVLRQTNVDTQRVEAETEYNAQSLPWRVYAFGKLQSTLTYNTGGSLASVADGRGHTTLLTNWKRGIPQQIQYPPTPEAPTGAIESATVDDNGRVTATTNEIGAKTCYGYDAMGRVSSVVYPSETQPGVCDISRWSTVSMSFQQVNADEYGLPAGHWRASRYVGNQHTHTYYDALWRPVLEETYDASNVAGTLSQSVKRYDSGGRLSFVSYPQRGIVNPQAVTQGSRTFYDALDRTTRVEQDSESGVLATTTEYLAGLQVRTTNPRNQQTTTSFMAWDQPGYDVPILSQQPEGKIIQIGRHPQFGWPLTLTQRNAANTLSQTRRYVYDTHAQLCKTIEPETGATVMHYDAAGNLDWSAAGLTLPADTACDDTHASIAARKAVRAYDARNRLTALTFPDGRGNQFWTYTPDSLPATITTYNAANSGAPVVNAYAYNQRRLLGGQGESIDQTSWYAWGIGYGYDALGNLASQTYPTGLVVDYAPNALGQATKAGTFASGAQYYPNGALKQFTYGNGIVHTMTQNARQLPSRVISSGNVLDFAYDYDNNGNPTTILDLVTGTPTAQHRWMSYDGLDRLITSASAMYGGSDHTHRFSYDVLDNIKSWQHAGVKDYADYVYDASHRLVNIRNTAGATVVGLAYDPQGNLSNKNGQGYGFDYGNRLRTVAGKEAYRYDGLGRRVQSTRTDGSQTTLWQYSQAGQMLFSSTWNGASYLNHTTQENVYLAGSLIATIDHDWPSNAITAVKYQHTDALGSPVAVTNTLGQVIERNNYEPYGAIIGKPTRSGIGYTGHVMDGATGLTYMQQRYYDQSVGRFLSVDPVTANANTGAMFNRYEYVGNNPYSYTDPDGRVKRSFARWLVKKILPESTPKVSPKPQNQKGNPASGQSQGASPKINEGQQGKHQVGHNNYQQGKSILTEDPAQLGRQAGTGQQVGKIDVGLPGSKERVDFGKNIGTYVDPAGNSSPTTNGIIHYGKNGIHIVPSRPNP